MKALFADSAYYLALLNADDQLNPAAIRLTGQLDRPLVTTSWVLTEVADALSRPEHRGRIVALIRSLQTNDRVTVVPADQELFDVGLDLFDRRPDKGWSLTDCISFVIMERMSLTDALTADHHFEQAGFNTLLK